MAEAKNLTVKVDIDSVQAVRDFATAYLRVADWQPERDLPCGCTPARLCEYHAGRRAIDHYHPETIDVDPSNDT